MPAEESSRNYKDALTSYRCANMRSFTAKILKQHTCDQSFAAVTGITEKRHEFY